MLSPQNDGKFTMRVTSILRDTPFTTEFQYLHEIGVWFQKEQVYMSTFPCPEVKAKSKVWLQRASTFSEQFAFYIFLNCERESVFPNFRTKPVTSS